MVNLIYVTLAFFKKVNCVKHTKQQQHLVNSHYQNITLSVIESNSDISTPKWEPREVA